jgi:hypothetical protein
MKEKNSSKNIAGNRFAACTRGGRLVTIFARAARRVPASEKRFKSSSFCRCVSSPAGLSSRINFKRCEVFRGKISRAKLKNKTLLEPRTHLRQTYE